LSMGRSRPPGWLVLWLRYIEQGTKAPDSAFPEPRDPSEEAAVKCGELKPYALEWCVKHEHAVELVVLGIAFQALKEIPDTRTEYAVSHCTLEDHAERPVVS
jgi:hypothetical protein